MQEVLDSDPLVTKEGTGLRAAYWHSGGGGLDWIGKAQRQRLHHTLLYNFKES